VAPWESWLAVHCYFLNKPAAGSRINPESLIRGVFVALSPQPNLDVVVDDITEI
jgi:hypothetical protein